MSIVYSLDNIFPIDMMKIVVRSTLLRYEGRNLINEVLDN